MLDGSGFNAKDFIGVNNDICFDGPVEIPTSWSGEFQLKLTPKERQKIKSLVHFRLPRKKKKTAKKLVADRWREFIKY